MFSVGGKAMQERRCREGILRSRTIHFVILFCLRTSTNSLSALKNTAFNSLWNLFCVHIHPIVYFYDCIARTDVSCPLLHHHFVGITAVALSPGKPWDSDKMAFQVLVTPSRGKETCLLVEKAKERKNNTGRGSRWSKNGCDELA